MNIFSYEKYLTQNKSSLNNISKKKKKKKFLVFFTKFTHSFVLSLVFWVFSILRWFKYVMVIINSRYTIRQNLNQIE